MKKILLSVLALSAFTLHSMEKKRPHEDEEEAKIMHGTYGYCHEVNPQKKEVAPTYILVNQICHADVKDIYDLLENKKVAFENRLEFFMNASLAIFCKNSQLATKDKAQLLKLIKDYAANMKYKFIRRNNSSNTNPENHEATKLTINEWRNVIRQKQIEKLQQEFAKISDEDKNRMAITNAIIKHLHTLTTIQKISESNAKLLASVDAPHVVPHALYLGYASAEAEKKSSQEIVNFLKPHDLDNNRAAYQSWLEQHSASRSTIALSVPF